MRPLVLSLGVCTCLLGAAWAQNAGGGGADQVPVGQTFKNFELPLYQNGQLKYTVTATQATGITQNRAEAQDVKIQIYENTAVTTTVTSPKADLYVAEHKMRTKNTVRIERDDMDATAQTCDFDLGAKKYLLRTNVKVILKHFDPGPTLTANGPAAPAGATSPAPRSLLNHESQPVAPGANSDTHSAPLPPTGPNPK